MVRDGFFKVKQEGGSFVVATFFNPTTNEEYTHCVRDYDYSDCSRDDDEAYNMEIREDARRAWLRHHGVVQTGDTVKVVRGRKVPVGTVAVVVDVTKWSDRYGRVQTVYAHLNNGMRTSVTNCEILR